MAVLFSKFSRSVWVLILALTLLSGCASLGPMGTPDFDSSFLRTIAAEEKLEHFAVCNVYAGSYMDGEPAMAPVYEGVLVMTDQRIIFTQWDQAEKYYKPIIWISYGDIKRVKKQNDSLFRYVAIEGPNESKNGYHMSGDNVEWLYAKIRASVKSHYRHD